MAFFLVLNLSVPFLLRICFSKPLPFYARSIGFVEDLFVVLEVAALGFISVPLAAIMGCCVHLVLLLDNFLFQTMQLRLTFSHFSHLHHIKSLYISARALGIHRWMMAAGIIVLGHAVLYHDFMPHRSLIIAGIFAGAVACCMPKKFGYNLDNFFFAAQKNIFSRKQKLEGHFSLLDPFAGKQLFDLKLERPHVVLVFLESFGAKHLSPRTTPNFDRLSKEGIFFSNFYSNGTLTYRALLAGLFGIPPGNTTEGLLPYVGVPFRGMPEMMKEAGYKTAFFHNGSLAYDKQWDFLESHFDVIADRNAMAEESSGWGVPDEDLMRHSMEWLEQQMEPAFMTLFTMTNHHPWTVPSHYEPPAGERFFQTLHYTDYALSLLVDRLKENTLLIVVGDHGQPLGEHGNFYNSRYLYEENVRVPLLIWGKGITPQKIEGLGSHVDLLATLSDLLKLKGETGHGASLLRDQERIIMLQNPYSEGFLGCRKGKWKWIQHELYDLALDPEEKNNITSQYPAIAEELHKKAERYAAYLDLYYQRQKKSRIAETVLELDLTGSMVTDKDLAELPDSLQRLNLTDCLLITDVGLKSVLERCDLEELILRGVTDVTGAAFQRPLPKLRKLELPKVEIGCLHYCPNLIELTVEKMSDEEMKMVAHHCQRLERFKLLDAKQITDEAIGILLKNNRHLGRLVLEGCLRLTDQTLKNLEHHPIEQLWLINAPAITEGGKSFLKKLPLRACPRFF